MDINDEARKRSPATLKEVEDAYIIAVLNSSQSIKEAAARLGLSKRGLYHRAHEDNEGPLWRAYQAHSWHPPDDLPEAEINCCVNVSIAERDYWYSLDTCDGRTKRFRKT